MKSEDEVQQLIMMEAPKHNMHLLRNNSGAMKDATGRLVRYGLGNISKEHNKNFKSSDLIGIEPVLITPEMVGHLLGVFCAVEIKREGWVYKHIPREVGQLNFIEWVAFKGGRAGFCNSLESFKAFFPK